MPARQSWRRCALPAKPAVVVQASAVGYYGAQRDAVLTEKSTRRRRFSAEVSKQWEPATAEVEMMGVRRIIARFGVVLSNDGGRFSAHGQTDSHGVGGRIGSGDQWLSWIHIDDVVRALRYLITAPKQSAYTILQHQRRSPMQHLST